MPALVDEIIAVAALTSLSVSCRKNLT